MINSISFCGIDGSGKTTQLELFNNYLQRKSVDSKIIKPEFYPYEKYKNAFNSEEILCLGTAFDFLRYNDLIDKSNNTQIKLYDRHKICYLALAYAFNVNNLEQLFKIYSVIKCPDLIVYFDTDVATSLERIAARNGKVSNRENYEILSRFKEGYEYFLEREKNSEIIRINSNKSIDEIEFELKQKVYSKVK